jgi:hypothetical protein
MKDHAPFPTSSQSRARAASKKTRASQKRQREIGKNLSGLRKHRRKGTP